MESLFGEEKTRQMKSVEMSGAKSDYVQVTKNGHSTDEVASALQKAIRRGNEKEALYWTSELYELGWWRYLLKRFAVMASEDIGLANNEAIIFVNSVAQLCFMENGKDNRRPDSLHFWHLALYMARSPKSRMVDYSGGAIIKMKEDGFRIEPPDYAVDQHTASGKLKGMGDKEFFTEGSLINNKKHIEGEEYWRDECLKLYGFADLIGARDESQF